MISQIFLSVLAATVVAADSTKYLVVKSSDDSINGNTLGFLHEGAGINYAFLGTSSQSSPLEYDESTQSLSYAAGGLPQGFAAKNGPVQITVAGGNTDITFSSDNVLLVNGSSDNFYACKNINDPYNYSKSSYALTYYTSDAPSGCIALTLEATSDDSPSESSSAAPVTTISTSDDGYYTTVTEEYTTYTSFCNTSSEIPTYVGGAAKYGSSGAFAALVGIAAALA